jgi:hypothetical protein
MLPATAARANQRHEIGRILDVPQRPHELMRWRLRLYCGHVVETQSHFTHRTLESAVALSISCPRCGLDPATIVDGEAIGLVEPAAGASTGVRVVRPRRATGSPKPTRAPLEEKVKELRRRSSGFADPRRGGWDELPACPFWGYCRPSRSCEG